ncbi:hypothetical protein RND71_017285 [Anisodus tanguticus]|uniref:Ubiquitin-like protease family profile domain-containing protein n=1 Tax=Anisodus tanguticus TaxID=243964 RepID=A0AAE1S379_9SOLA|nr:hypothetical protein RND71_017285 [Anisodus tanguticus]
MRLMLVLQKKCIHRSDDKEDVGSSKKRKLMLRNIVPSSVEKTTLKLPAFEHVPEKEEIQKDVNYPPARNLNTKHSAIKSSNELRLLRRDYNLLNNEDHYNRDGLGDDRFEKDDISLAGDRMGDHLADKDKNSKVDDLFGPFDMVDVGLKEGDHVSDDAVDECVKIGDDVGDNVGKISGNEVDWYVVHDIEFSKFTQPDSVKNDMTMKEVDNVVVDDAADECAKVVDDVEWSTIHDELGVGKNCGDELENHVADEEKSVMEEVYLSTIPDIEFSKFTQSCSDKSVGAGAEKNVMITNVEKNMEEASAGLGKCVVILDDTPIVARRSRKKAKACDLPYVTNFEFGGSNVRARVVLSTKPIFFIKHPFEISIESEIDLNLTKKYINFIARSLRVKEKSDGIPTVDSFENRMVAGLPTQDNTDCDIFVVAFDEYLIEGREISKGVNDIDVVRSRYSALLWD